MEPLSRRRFLQALASLAPCSPVSQLLGATDSKNRKETGPPIIMLWLQVGRVSSKRSILIPVPIVRSRAIESTAKEQSEQDCQARPN